MEVTESQDSDGIPETSSDRVQYRLGDKDYLSRLPDLCLLDIFQFLKRKDLFNVFLANKRLGPVTLYPRLAKWEDGILSIMQIERGFGFDFDVASAEYPFNVNRDMTSYHYKIEWNEEEGGFVEKRSLNGVALRSCESRHDLPIPENFFANLKEILRNHGVKSLFIEKLRFDADFFSNMQFLLSRHSVKSLSLSGVVAEEINDKERKSFVHFVKSIGVKELNLELSPGLNSLINGQFFEYLSDSSVVDLNTDTTVKDGQAVQFHAHQSIIPSLSRFENIESSYIVVHANWVISLLIAHMNRLKYPTACKSKSMSTWKLGLEGNLTANSIASQIYGTGYSYSDRGELKNEFTSAHITWCNRRGIRIIEVKFSIIYLLHSH